eukprot:TRINITY_DN96411_c0_g1_i1.p2 TRINITY_DN96411_c0_g1~~TRINITY_DN96411_c0_g1_i1.p2  ORF type:complete len:255 (+),score=24.06 TRINITY_DN96411_c0_g1_i1:165-929(+)
MKNSMGTVGFTDVLIINDGTSDQEMLLRYLKEYDVSFSVATTKDEAFKKLKDFIFKLILIDIAFTSFEDCGIIQLIKTDLQLNIPVVAIIGDDTEATKKKCFSAGIDACFSRPISKIELVGVLTQFLPNEILSTRDIEPITYQTIDLSYLNELSMGDKGYELEMAEKFVEIISDEIVLLMDYLERGDVEALKRVVHKMRSTIYLMGLRPKIITAIEAIEYDNLSTNQLKVYVDTIISVCERAKEEVHVFLESAK